MDFEVIKRLLAALEREIDIVTRLRAFAFADLETERVVLDGLSVSVVTARGLYRMQRSTVRLKDRADAQALRERFWN